MGWAGWTPLHRQWICERCDVIGTERACWFCEKDDKTRPHSFSAEGVFAADEEHVPTSLCSGTWAGLMAEAVNAHVDDRS